MSVVAHLRDRLAGWVHESVRGDPIEASFHQTFIWMRLASALCTIALIPPYMALQGGLSGREALIVLCAAAPLASFAVLSRTGRFGRAQAVATLAYLIVGVAFALAAGGLSGPAMAWLVLAPVESLFVFSAASVLAAGGLSLAILIVFGVAGDLGWLSAGASAPARHDVFVIAPAFIYASLLALAAVRMRALHARSERIGAARYQTLSNVMGDLILRHDRGGAVLFASRASESLFGLRARDLMGRGLFERLLVQDRPTFLKTIAEACDSPGAVSCHVRLRTASAPSAQGGFEEPVFTWIELRAHRLVAEGDATDEDDGARVLAVARDISREKRHEQELESARAEAERANAWKDRFLANMSHELRTPLNAIIGFSEILGNADLAPADPAKRREYAGIIHSSGEHLLEVVNSILDISKIEAGRFAITPEPFDVAALIDACCDMISLKAAQAGVTIKRVCEPVEELVADKRACRQVLINLVGNALKFTPRDGVVTVGARRDGSRLALFVSDTGCGMSAYDLPRLGGAFFQAGQPSDRTYEGTGLGLSVVRGLVGLHGGEILVESGPGAGTCVTVRLPMDCRDAAPAASSARIIAIPREAAANDRIEPAHAPIAGVRKSA